MYIYWNQVKSRDNEYKSINKTLSNNSKILTFDGAMEEK